MQEKTKINIKDEMSKLEDKIHLKEYDADGEFVRKMLKHLRDIITVDFGTECKDFEEECVVCEAWRAINVLTRLYTEE